MAETDLGEMCIRDRAVAVARGNALDGALSLASKGDQK